MMSISVFLSRPTVIAKQFEAGYIAFKAYLLRKGFRIHRLGADQYTMDAPLKGVMDLMKTCRAAIILGYPQYEVRATLSKAATPWNQIEATLAFKQCIPVLVIAHNCVSGGVFDYGVIGEYVHTVNLNMKDWYRKKDFKGVFKEWKKRIK